MILECKRFAQRYARSLREQTLLSLDWLQREPSLVNFGFEERLTLALRHAKFRSYFRVPSLYSAATAQPKFNRIARKEYSVTFPCHARRVERCKPISKRSVKCPESNALPFHSNDGGVVYRIPYSPLPRFGDGTTASRVQNACQGEYLRVYRGCASELIDADSGDTQIKSCARWLLIDRRKKCLIENLEPSLSDVSPRFRTDHDVHAIDRGAS